MKRFLLPALLTIASLSGVAVPNVSANENSPDYWFEFYTRRPQGVHKACNRGRRMNPNGESVMALEMEITKEEIRDGDCSMRECRAQTAGKMRAMAKVCPGVW